MTCAFYARMFRHISHWAAGPISAIYLFRIFPFSGQIFKDAVLPTMESHGDAPAACVKYNNMKVSLYQSPLWHAPH